MGVGAAKSGPNYGVNGHSGDTHKSTSLILSQIQVIRYGLEAAPLFPIRYLDPPPTLRLPSAYHMSKVIHSLN